MNIGFVTTWLERGATYVTKTYMELLAPRHNLYVFARGGEYADKRKDDPYFPNITWGLRLAGTRIDWRQFSKWIKKNNIEVVFFNEQSDFECLYKLKIHYPDVILGAYIDYYKEDTVKKFEIYDFLICNTKRHYSVFNWHPAAYYVPWGTDLSVFNYKKSPKPREELVFFHSMGMSPRKGTDVLINAFIKGEFYKKNARLIIHTQIDISNLISKDDALKFNIEIINKEVPHPGLYYLGDVYVYPTTLDGLGLTVYEALASGLPVIATDVAPMNEIITEDNGKLVKVSSFRCRKDAYYWPQAFVDEDALIAAMQFYVENRDKIDFYRSQARKYAEEKLNIFDRRDEVLYIFENAKAIDRNVNEISALLKDSKRYRRELVNRYFVEEYFPNIIKHFIRQYMEGRRKNVQRKEI